MHGSTRRQVHAHYLEADLPALQRDNCRLFECGTRNVHVDAHVEVAGAFNPVPLRLIGEPVHVRWDSNLVRASHGWAGGADSGKALTRTPRQRRTGP